MASHFRFWPFLLCFYCCCWVQVPVSGFWIEVSPWKVYFGLTILPSLAGCVFGIFLGIGCAADSFRKHPKCLSGMIVIFGIVDILVGLVILLTFYLDMSRRLIWVTFFVGYILQTISGLWRIIGAGFKSEIVLKLWILIFLPSLMSPFAFASGFPSLMLICSYKNDNNDVEETGTGYYGVGGVGGKGVEWFRNQKQNQAGSSSSTVCITPESAIGSEAKIVSVSSSDTGNTETTQTDTGMK